ncbi:hypothetical protein I3843_10G129900 [Carya illinoinensis]|uniref:Uncharacterized protein n=1 Tax=Carya illinoinensis TaxID=32201 RepID=A0A922DZY9_CARIL|nr:hypothetical protein I3842_10G136900 [Carya illinoinensis]KAG7960561.1 hypothetical protein I3843_10G129900 [Carya illinoinensis]
MKIAATSGTANPLNGRITRIPPKRGQIKVGIISKLVKMVIRAVSKAGRGLGRKKKLSQQTRSVIADTPVGLP